MGQRNSDVERRHGLRGSQLMRGGLFGAIERFSFAKILERLEPDTFGKHERILSSVSKVFISISDLLILSTAKMPLYSTRQR